MYQAEDTLIDFFLKIESSAFLGKKIFSFLFYMTKLLNKNLYFSKDCEEELIKERNALEALII